MNPFYSRFHGSGFSDDVLRLMVVATLVVVVGITVTVMSFRSLLRRS